VNAIGALFTLVAVFYTFTLPREKVLFPLILAALYMTRGQVLAIGPANFTIPQLLVTAGFLRARSRGEHITDGLHTADKLLIGWAVLLVADSAFHTPDAWVYRCGLVWTELGCYFLYRTYITDVADAMRVFKWICAVSVPLAVLMLVEKVTDHNVFGSLGGVVEYSLIRDGHVRAAGPFAHPILAGTTGTAIMALGLAVRKDSPRHTWLGFVGGGGIVMAATSSGPIMMFIFILAALFAWRWRYRMKTVRWLLLSGVLLLNAVMHDPVYFLMARIDISGGSQGYFRAQLIRSSIEHLSEWWLAGTDWTRHWMASGNHANTNHTDITNQLLAEGVLGGLPLMAVYLAIVLRAFKDVGRALAQHAQRPLAEQTLIWGLGALLFGYFMNYWTISLFDQSVMFFYLCTASIQSIVRTHPLPAPSRSDERAAPPAVARDRFLPSAQGAVRK